MPTGEQLNRSTRQIWRDPALHLTVLIATALLFGGGGVSNGLGNLVVQLAALAVLAANPGAFGPFVRKAPRGLAMLTLASCLLPLLQLVPLPPQVWSIFPGRDMVAQAQALTGGPGWFPVSLDAGRTLVAFIGTFAPLAIIIVGSALPREALTGVARRVIALAIAVALFGSLHLIDARMGDLYAGWRELPGVLVGTFANRNSAAIFFVSALLLAGALPLPQDRRWRIARYAGAGFLALCVVLTGSRTGMALLAVPAAFALARAAIARKQALAGALAAVALVGGTAAVLVATQPGRIGTSLARFADGDGQRAQMREDAAFATRHYWPVGAGMGTFDEVFQVDESLEYVSPRRAGRAHMDYLELAIEAGLPGLILAAGWLGWVVLGGVRALLIKGAWLARAGVAIAACIAAQSTLSFPLRNQAMLCIAAFAVVLIARFSREEPAP
ncbi:O-antigen ligase family protein [Tsuneonella mangrovi]|uniref:O-antigen ligase family protein n=1 Tax=Tsuneonella mangrovi TaxID=1982042 RepID=UPI000BA21EB4|nr:O-antigen ligase family protein [Tsuneonella mangrovi]